MSRPRFRVVEKSFIGHALCEEGDDVFYTPPENSHVGANLWPINDEAQELVDEQGKTEKDASGNDVYHPASAHAAKPKKKAASTDGPVDRATKAPASPVKGKTKAGGRVIDADPEEGEPDEAAEEAKTKAARDAAKAKDTGADSDDVA